MIDWLKLIRDRDKKPLLEYTSQGWQTRLAISTDSGWNSEQVVSTEQSKWQIFCDNLHAPKPLGFHHENTDITVTDNLLFHNLNMIYAHVLSCVTSGKSEVTILDWGGALGHYYQMGRTLFPNITFDFHCKEVPKMVELGKIINPHIHWYDDETCLQNTYDLVMINSSLQYIPDWITTIQKIMPSVKHYLFLSRLPVVEGKAFVAIQRVYGTEMLHNQLNRQEVLSIIQKEGCKPVREFITGEIPVIKNAPEQCVLRSWLFQKEL